MKWIVALLALVTLSGCLSPDIPEDAPVAEDEALPGLKLTAWTEEIPGRTRMHGVIENHGDVSYDIRIGCGHPWTSTILSPDGQEVRFREVLEEPGCAPFWDVLAPGGDMEVQYSWDGRDHDVENDIHTQMPDGLYLWSLQFHLRDRDDFLEVLNPIIIGADPLEAFEMTLSPHGQYAVDVAVHNNGAAQPFWSGCGAEWDWSILDGNGTPLLLEPMATCQGFSETTFEAGAWHNATFQWDGRIWDADTETLSDAPAGDYAWQIRFGLQGTSGEVLVEQATFRI